MKPLKRLLALLRAAWAVFNAADQPLSKPSRGRRPWSPCYAVRRSAWHALDHAWEIEDRSSGG